jgi:hypothetical protein
VEGWPRAEATLAWRRRDVDEIAGLWSGPVVTQRCPRRRRPTSATLARRRSRPALARLRSPFPAPTTPGPTHNRSRVVA